ncbi:MAG: alanine--tRNA ligase, partial [Dehalococcoidia bacterium]
GDCGRFLEVWNLVFMTYLQQEDGSRKPLPAKNIDTGAGLERLSAVALFLDGLKGKRPPSAYDTDLFAPIIRRIEELSGRKYGQDGDPRSEATDRAMRIVAEHARAAAFLIGDERTPTVPSNEERGYAVRRIIRRAVYFGRHALGIEEPFLTEVAKAVTRHMEGAYPELRTQRQFVLQIVNGEETGFHATLSRGIELLEEVLARQSGDGRNLLSGEDIFLLHDTYGFPVELTREIARERGFTIDEAGFQAEMEKQRGRARAAARGGGAATTAANTGLDDLESTFVGYETLSTDTSVLALLAAHGEPVEPSFDKLRMSDSAEQGDTVEVALAETPFYPEAGGQVGDRGEIVGPQGRVAVEDTQPVAERLIVHRGRVAQGRIAVGDSVTARVDERHRQDTMRNHTGTHLLHAALRQVLGTHVRQSGSLVAPDRLRFDFTHGEALSPEQIAEVQRLVNEKVRANLPVAVRHSSFDQAMAEGVLAFFGEAYGQEVRVVEVPEDPSTGSGRFSAELCGGTHCQRTGDIGFLLIVDESSIGAGLRRIEALTGRGAEEHVRRQQEAIGDLSRRLGA